MPTEWHPVLHLLWRTERPGALQEVLAMMKKLFSVFACALTLTTTIAIIGASPVDAAPAHDDQITRLYITALGRYPDAEGQDYWTQRRMGGETLIDLAREMITFPEAQSATSGDFIVDAYRNALDRRPDPAGHAYWLSLEDPAAAVAYISDSEEHRQITGTLAPPPSGPVVGNPAAKGNHPDGWIDAGHGVFVPSILLAIRWCESKDSYTAANRRSSARGAYQFLTSSWAAYGHAERYGVNSADKATPAQQDEAAVITWRQSGTRPWAASRHCWG